MPHKLPGVLGDEEITQAIINIPDIVGTCITRSDEERAIAQAQLSDAYKGIYEWLESECDNREHYQKLGRIAPSKKRDCPYCYEMLGQKAKEGRRSRC